MATSFPKSGPPRMCGEILEQCPYDSYHWVRPAKLNEHLAKCRKNYEDKLFKDKGYHQLSLNCLHNCQHKVLEAEWEFHMARCPDRKKLWTYKLQAGPLKEKFPELLSITGEDLPRKREEAAELYDGLKPGVLVTDNNQEVKLAHIGKTYPEICQYEAEVRGKTMSEDAEDAWALNNEKKIVKKEPAYQINYTQEEIDYWNPPQVKSKPFSWLLHNSRPQGYVTNYPPGLNKRERREFEKRNAELFEKKIAAEAKVREAAAAAAEAAAEAAIGQEEGDQGTETTGAGDTDNGGNVPEEEEEDDGWFQFIYGGWRIAYLIVVAVIGLKWWISSKPTRATKIGTALANYLEEIY